jgi:PilZ domain
MSERRKETRQKLMAFTPVYDLHPRTLLGYLADLTLSGALVIGANLTTIKKETVLEINFPRDLADISPLLIPARIAWCHSDERSRYFNIGIEFTEMTPVYEDLFKDILERYQFRHPLSGADVAQTDA